MMQAKPKKGEKKKEKKNHPTKTNCLQKCESTQFENKFADKSCRFMFVLKTLHSLWNLFLKRTSICSRNTLEWKNLLGYSMAKVISVSHTMSGKAIKACC